MDSSTINFDEMARLERPVISKFDPGERLFYRLDTFYRFNLGDACVGLQVRSPDFSVNREYPQGVPEFVLYPNWLDFGIAEFFVRDIPGPRSPSVGGKLYSLRVEHDPLDDNYYHAELRTYKTEDVQCERCGPNGKVNDEVKRAFRQLLAERMRVIRTPGTSITTPGRQSP